ncbi:MAG TPA: C-terminal binding protein [Thermoleophilaceae bacterium]|jgi:D-3-phosphoglycerate dehydrogenase|nr:C-terminal binding protein [Thermoleophilaceae bacterium]
MVRVVDDQTNPSAHPPVAVYTDWGELDITPGVDLLERSGWQVRTVGSTDSEAIVAAAPDAVAVCVGYARLGRETLERLACTRIVSTLSAGVDMVDVEAAHELGIWVANIPDAATEEVSSHAVAMALALVRHLPRLDREVRAGAWALDVLDPPRLPQTLTFAILGLGRIGRRAAELAHGIFGRVVAHDPFIDDDAWPAGVERVELEKLLATADVLSLHMPLVPDSERPLDGDRLSQLPAGAFVVNVSRGELIDHAALLAALDDGHVAGAALDVLEAEPPPPDHPILSHPRVLLTPHAAFLSDRSARAYPLRQAENVLAWQRTGRPVTPVGGRP